MLEIIVSGLFTGLTAYIIVIGFGKIVSKLPDSAAAKKYKQQVVANRRSVFK